MDKVCAHYTVYDIKKECNMVHFGRDHIPGFKPELGYGYYEFTQNEFYKPHKKVILVHKVCRYYDSFISASSDSNEFLRTRSYTLELVHSLCA